MNAETLRKEGQNRLFREDLEEYRRVVANLIGDTQENKDLGDPQVVMDCLTALTDLVDELTDTWWALMRQARSDDDDPDSESSEDGGNVRLDTLAERKLHDVFVRAHLAAKELLVSQ